MNHVALSLIDFLESEGFYEVEEYQKILYQKDFSVKDQTCSIVFSSRKMIGSVPNIYYQYKGCFYIFSCVQSSSARLFNHKLYMETESGINELVGILKKICSEVDGIANLSNFFMLKNQSFIPIGNSLILNSRLPMIKIMDSHVTFYERSSEGDTRFMKIIEKQPEALYILHNYAMNNT